jgi:hypothetical protein
MPNNPNDLSAAQVEQFISDGYCVIEGTFSAELAGRCRSELWMAMGLSPDDPTGWKKPVVGLGFMAQPLFVEAANTPRLPAAYDALVGDNRWLAPIGLGTFPIRFPSSEDPGDIGWHVDMSFGTEHHDFMQWRVNVKSRGRALLMLFLLSDVDPQDGPTRLRIGSHLDVARRLLPRGEDGMTLGELAAGNFAETEDCEEALATGPAGTVGIKKFAAGEGHHTLDETEIATFETRSPRRMVPSGHCSTATLPLGGVGTQRRPSH